MAHATHERTRRLGHGDTATVPLSTYRVQLTESFTFADAAARLDYVAALGISHLYLSPILTAAPGSTHFYDVVDHSQVSPVLGGAAGLRALASAAKERGIGLIADVVPNHMAVPTPAFHNAALWSVLALGNASPFAHWFDVDWSSNDGVLMPVLGDRVGTVLAREELTLDTMVVPGFERQGSVPVLRYHDHVFPVKEGTENLPMAALVGEQHYRLAYWRVANEELNYRRFFDVGSLVGLRVEDADVWEQTHRVLIDLVNDGTLAGLRIDHPDGLADPAGYLARLAEATEGAWVVVEKILEEDEQLSTSWKTAGTTGYDAAWRIGALLRDPSGSAALGGTLYQLTGDAMGSLPAIVDAAKREILHDSLASETRRLATLAHEVCRSDVRLRDHTWVALYDSLRAILVNFPTYRPYIVAGAQAPSTSLEWIDASATRARAALDTERHETLEVVVDLLKGAEVGSAGRTLDVARGELVTRFQQTCGAVTAKGVEDTAYYRWTHLMALCEVGSPAGRFAMPPEAFHAWAASQQVTYPHAMTSLTTHDTKRSEDVRARMGVLSEVPAEWEAWLERVRAETAGLRPSELDGRTENLWWQTLVGSVDDAGAPMEWNRLEGFLTKAMREAKSHTSWVTVNEAYETAVLWFAQTTHADPAVRALVAEWTTHTAQGVRAAILSQKLIQLTMPGVPDVYQGTEEVRPLMVDPDNRIAVDYDRLSDHLDRVERATKVRTLSEEKLLITARTLHARNARPGAFTGTSAGYSPLPSSSGHAVVFARSEADAPAVVTIATRLAIELERRGGWGEHSVTLPEGEWVDAFTGASHAGGSASLATLLKTLPVALLVQS